MTGLKLLPATASGFSKKDYWDSFFAERKSDFEWYGEYDELAPLLKKFCSTKDSFLIVGCGSSNLSERLYTDGFEKQLNIDISTVIINRMQCLHPYLVFREDDVTCLHCADEEFSCVLDKGTFDALTPLPPKESYDDKPSSDSSKPETAKPIQMLNEVQRVLKNGGRFVCISLLQAHVAELLISYFVSLGWILKINRCEAAEKHEKSRLGLPVYVCLFMKPFQKQTETVIEFVGLENGGKPQRLKSVQEVLAHLKSEMASKFYASALKTIGHFAKEESEWTLCEENGKVKYKLFAVDVMTLTKNPVDKQMIIFIIPQGREMEFMFSTHEGRTIIANQMGFTRAVFVALQRDREYISMEEVQQEIGNHVQFITPDPIDDVKVKIPVVTVGTDLGKRDVIHRGKSEFSGEYTVEDVEVGKNVLRRLIFLEAPNVIQSEVPLRVVNQKGKKSIRKSIKIPLSHQLTSDYHGIMSLSIPMLWYFMKLDVTQTVDTVLVGLGGGLLVSFLHQYFPMLQVTAVELDREIVEIGRKYFGLSEHEGDDRLKIVVDDGLKFIKDTDSKFHVIMFDVDNKSVNFGLSCPPSEFLTAEMLELTKKALIPEGILVVNFVCRNSSLEEKYVTALSSHFPFIYKLKLLKEVNTLFFCFLKIPPGNSKVFSKSLVKSVQYLRDMQLRDATKSKQGQTSLIEIENTTEDTIINLTDDSEVEDLCSRFKILR